MRIPVGFLRPRVIAAALWAVLLLYVPTRLYSQTPAAPKELQSADITEILRRVSGYKADTGTSEQYVVEGKKPFTGPVLLAQTIIFSPGSQLVLAGNMGDRTERIIWAQSIRVLPGAAPSISWDRDEQRTRRPQGTPASVDKAAPGLPGDASGSPGLPGNDGREGNPGAPGRSAPTVYLIADNIEGGPLNIDLKGEDGYPGGQGQAGGDGGAGRNGRDAVPGVFDCRSGGGNGGDGGKGGTGGRGGLGGRGGNGGQLIVVSSHISAARLKEVFTIDVSAGQGGSGGLGGDKGVGGPAGLGGSGAGLCGGGNQGSVGLNGTGGRVGDIGPSGASGVVGSVVIDPAQGEKLWSK